VAHLAAAARCELCVIGASTGGPLALQRILERVPAEFPMPIAIVQHMPVGFTRPFADRLNGLSRMQVSEASEGDRLLPGKALLAPAGHHLRVTSSLAVVLAEGPHDSRNVPSVDVTMKSAARARPGRVFGILLTGMGQDGAEGMATIRASGGFTIGESEASCVVYGMPRSAKMRGGVDCMLPLPEIISFMEALTAGVRS
jgi:two-component system chemotaxis response regulator CheB